MIIYLCINCGLILGDSTVGVGNLYSGPTSNAPTESSSRHDSLTEIDVSFLKVANYADTIRKLDSFYGIGRAYALIGMQSYALSILF